MRLEVPTAGSGNSQAVGGVQFFLLHEAESPSESQYGGEPDFSERPFPATR